jgi:hypothetical protein
VETQSTSSVVLARDVRRKVIKRKVIVYDRRVHGSRFVRPHGAYRYFYGGYYYATPWWTFEPGVAINVAPAYAAGPTYAYRPQHHVRKVITTRKVVVYDRHVHGPRFAYRHGPYRYFHAGYYYATPWWAYAPGVTINVAPGYAATPSYAHDAEPGVDDGYAVDDGQDYGDQGDEDDQY